MKKKLNFEIEFCQSVLSRDPENLSVMEMLANYFSQAGRIDEGLVLDQKIVSIDPDNFFARRMLQSAYEFMGDYESWFKQWKIVQLYYDSTIIPDIEKVFHEQGYIPALQAYINIKEERYKNGDL